MKNSRYLLPYEISRSWYSSRSVTSLRTFTVTKMTTLEVVLDYLAKEKSYMDSNRGNTEAV